MHLLKSIKTEVNLLAITLFKVFKRLKYCRNSVSRHKKNHIEIDQSVASNVSIMIS